MTTPTLSALSAIESALANDAGVLLMRWVVAAMAADSSSRSHLCWDGDLRALSASLAAEGAVDRGLDSLISALAVGQCARIRLGRRQINGLWTWKVSSRRLEVSPASILIELADQIRIRA